MSAGSVTGAGYGNNRAGAGGESGISGGKGADVSFASERVLQPYGGAAG